MAKKSTLLYEKDAASVMVVRNALFQIYVEYLIEINLLAQTPTTFFVKVAGYKFAACAVKVSVCDLSIVLNWGVADS